MKKILLKFFLLMLLLGVLFITPVNAAPPNSPLNPQCEGETNPLLIDNTIPEFSWIFDDPDGGDTQSAYQILVSTSNDNLVLDIGDMWNSGKVLLSSSTVSYSGSELQSGTNYYWKVRTWDVGDSAGFYCSIQTFKMAFFLLKQTLNTSDSSYSIVLGDIDNDGDLDSIVGNRSEANRIFKNDGSGSFSSFQTSAETDYTLSLAIGDIDNDGDIDYVAGNNSNVHGNRIYKNDGTGNFDLFGTSDEADYTMSVALGDIDNDGDLDYIVGNNSNVHGNRVYKNDGTGNFSLFGTSEEADYTMSVALGDIDNDGDLDLVVGNRGYNRIYKNNGIGDFSLFETSEESDATYSVALGDIDNDGDLDYVAGNSNSEGNSVYKNDGTGCFSFVEISTETKNTASIAFIDIDNDGDLDYIAANNSSATDDIYINNGTGSFNLLESTNANDSSTCVAVGDIDNDNDLDYIISTYRYGTQVYFSGESFDNPNSTPLPPSSGLNSNYAGGIVTLTWDPGTDTETPASGLYYNIRIGTVSASGDTVSGVYGTPLLGNYLGSKIGASQLGVKLCSLPDNTTFYWSVQTIDSNLEKSSWSTEQSFFCPNVEPGAITDLAAIPWYETGEINLTWTAPGDDGDKGETASYIVKYSTFQFSDQTSFDNAAAYAQSWTPLWAGQTENKIITGFMGGTTYYFAIEALDDASNQASLSNIDGNNSTCATVEDITEPGTITTLVVSSWAQVKFKWIAPGDNDYDTDGLASGYIVKYSISGNITNDTEFNNAATYSQTWIPASPGTEEEKDINGLNPGLVYYFSIKTYDENNNYSSISETTNSSAVAGNFSIDTSQDIIDVSNASLAWGDYDEDGDMDLAICGYDGVSLHTRIYRNDNGTMIFFQSLTGVKSRYSTQQLAWGDYDGDGDLDLFMCGAVNSSESSFITRIYRNDNGTFNQDIGQSLPGACSLDIADYDNDGDIDLALMGGTNNTDIYRNDNGIFFKDTQQSLSGKAHGTLAWGDYDNDGDQDLLMGGETSGWPPDRDFILYRNDDGILIDSELFSYGRACFSIKWVDFDNDGDLDIAISDEYNTELLRNNNGSFTYLRRFSEDSGSVSWGDYDNDGDLDLFLAGYDWQGGIKIFRNDNGEFTETHEFEKFSGGPCVTWVDYDNDGDLDICLAGYRSSEDYDYETRIYKNMQSEFISSSSRPEPPVSYNTYYDNKLNFRWDPGVDTETPTDGLYYNIRVGTTLGGDDIVSGSYGASLFGNYLRPKISSATLGITLNMTEPTTYYWAVQTIDTSLQRSLWGEEQIWSASYIDQPPDEPTLPQCENQTNPTNIGTLTPAFSWMFNDPNMDDQYAYQIIVSSDPATLALDIGDRWDSGKVVLSTNTAVYNGSPLYGDVTYWWKVRTWDADVSTGPYCSAQTFKVSIAVLNQAVTEDDPTLDIAIGDIDGDGDLDMICVNFYAVNRIYKNDGGIFSLHQSPGGAYDTQALAVGDIDNDGDLDYVTGNREQANRVYKNNGSGDFSYYQSSSETDYTYALDLGDIDGDGDLDLVVGNYNLNSSNRIYKNNGSGSFSLFYTFEEKDNTADLALGDIDNDGDLDLVVGNSAFNCLRIYKNDGIGNFSLFDNPDGAGSGYSLALGDIDNDGDLDLLTGNCIFKNDGVGNFSLFATTDDYANSYAIALGDIDNDGDLDYVKGYKWGEYMTIRLNDGTGNFSLYETIPDQDYIYALALGDLDNDGGLDIVAGKAGNAYSSGRIYYYPEPNRIYFSNTHSSNQNQSPSAPLSFNANYSSSVLTLDWGNGSDVETSSGGLYYNIKVGTSSGDDDIIQGLYSSPRLGNYLRPKISSTTLGVNIRNLPEGTTTYWSVRTIDSGLSVSPWSTEQSIILPDQIPNSPGNMRCENLIDPMAVYDTTPELSWEYDGGQSQGAYQILVSTSSINLAGDIGDKWDTGKVNSSNNNVSYAGSSLSADTTYFWKVRTWDTSASSGTYCSEQKFRMAFFYLQQTSAESDYTYAVALGDLDNDGDLDYIAGNCSNPFDEFYNRIYKNNGTGSFSLFETASEKNYTNSLAVGDIDNDGDLDYIAGAYNRTNSIYVNNGSGSFTLKESSIENDQTYSVAVGDIDNDGDMDYIAGNHGLNRVYKNDGTGCFSSFLNSQENDSTRAVVIGDIDNDGDMDYIAGNYDQSNRVYKNNGNGNFTLWESSIETDNTYSLILGDIDNDGDLDLAVGNYGQSNRVYTNNGDGNFSLYDTSIESDYTYSIGLGDVDNDGDLDLLCGNYGASYDYQSNKLYENDGTGKFTIWQLSMEEDSTRSIAIGDIDNDGDLDYICGNSSSYTNTRNKIYISKKALSNPNSSPSAPVVLSNDYSEGVLSFTWGDGTDIETSSTGLYYSIRVGTYSSSGNIISGVHGSPLMGNYIRPHISSTTLGINLNNLPTQTTYYWSIRTIDTGLTASSWSVEQSTYIATTNQPPNSPQSLQCENRTNPIVVSDTTPEFSWIFSDSNIGDGDFQTAYQILVSSNLANINVDIGDVWDSGKVLSSQSNNISYNGVSLLAQTTYWWKVRCWDQDDSTGTYCSNQTFTMGFFFWKEDSSDTDNTRTITIGDVDNDGDMDYIAGNYSGYDEVYTNDGTGSFTKQEITYYGDRTVSLALGDIDNDGDLDYIVGNDIINMSGSNVYGKRILKNDGEGNYSVINSTEHSTGNMYCVNMGDIDNDGDIDYIAGVAENQANQICINDGSGNFSIKEVSSETDSTMCIAIYDIDSDGDLDYIAGNYGGNRVYTNDGTGSFSLYQTLTESDDTDCIVFGDIDNDGDIDFIAGNNSASNRTYKNDGAGNFSLFQTSVEQDTSRSLSLGDIDNDGDLDLVCGNLAGANRIYTNDGTGVFALIETNIEIDNTYAIGLVDIEDDGDLDLIVGNGGINSVFYSDKAASIPNTMPSSPSSGFTDNYADGELTLSWGDGSDTETGTSGLYYSIRIGTGPGGDNIVAESYASPLLGNYIRPMISTTTLGIKIKNLTPDVTYYWSIKTIDAGLSQSAWSIEQEAESLYIAPSNITDLTSSSGYDPGEVKLSWTATGDNGGTGDITEGKYRVHYSSNALDTWDTSPYSLEWSMNTSPGNTDEKTVTGLTGGTTYYFWIKIADEVPLWSDVSNKTSSSAQTGDTTDPATINDLVATGCEQIKLVWTAPG
ncbi:MAG: VCBS repeat-containing protein, partial [Melioribacteraceae bacterium]|nr:VCBS repeat-containing protein [Melioribacteraceae bacterium]